MHEKLGQKIAFSTRGKIIGEFGRKFGTYRQ
jgi:hypothetical protein